MLRTASFPPNWGANCGTQYPRQFGGGVRARSSTRIIDPSGRATMTFEEILNQAMALLQRQGRVSYRALKRQCDLDESYVEDLKLELIEVHQVAVDQDNTMLVWTGAAAAPAAADALSLQARVPDVAPLTYTPPHLTDKILAARPALEGERKQVTVL